MSTNHTRHPVPLVAGVQSVCSPPAKRRSIGRLDRILEGGRASGALVRCNRRRRLLASLIYHNIKTTM